jgi:tryptophan 2,3-dioxygenase
LYYSEYLQLEKILSAQILESKSGKNWAHEEMLFIITHQTYELWFKQILFELDSIIFSFSSDNIKEDAMLVILARLQRIAVIFDVLIDQFKIIETMTPMDFLEFRDFLVPASGFQSLQFRTIVIRMGISEDISQGFYRQLSTRDCESIDYIRSMPNLFELIDNWLSRIPFIYYGNFHFWKKYLVSMRHSISSERDIIIHNDSLCVKDKESQLKQLDTNEKYIQDIVVEELYNKRKSDGECRLSYKAMMSALFIILYRDHVVLHTPYQILSTIKRVDSLLEKWLRAHIALVTNVIGNKIGTGGTSGAVYLSKSAESHCIFRDLINIPTLIVRSSMLPKLPANLKDSLTFDFIS